MFLDVQLSDCHSCEKSYLDMNKEDFTQKNKLFFFYPIPIHLVNVKQSSDPS